MMSREITEQEDFWGGDFGNEYTDRNQFGSDVRAKYFAKMLSKMYGVWKVLELGSNRGNNLQSIRTLSKNYELNGVEINEKAYAILKSLEGVKAHNSSIQDFKTDERFDLVMILGVMIHLNPDDLPAVYRKMYDLSSRYILINEYFNPSPTQLAYRGHDNKLYKRDFGGEFWDLHGDKVKLVDYGFLWKRVEPTWDDVTWWIFEKTGK
jgi:pseudaminic acid biosynthesis-associated methylase